MQIEQQVRGEAYRLGQGQHKIKCPSCSPSRKNKTDKTLSLKIEQDKILFQCWHCNQQGIVPLAERVEKINRVETMSIAKKIDKTSLTEAALAWLKSRGISKETAEKANKTEKAKKKREKTIDRFDETPIFEKPVY